MSRKNTSSLQTTLDPLKGFISDLYAKGGFPLVMLGLAAANLFLPFTGYDNLERIGISSILTCAALNLLHFTSKMLFEQRRAAMEAEARQREIVLKAICDIAANSASDVAKLKIEELRKSVDVAWVYNTPDVENA